MLYRHGDVLIQKVEALPTPANQKAGHILARGEITGHSHRMAVPQNVQLWEHAGELYIEVKEPTQLIHEEHKAILLDKGFYKTWMQREYSPEAIRRVLD